MAGNVFGVPITNQILREMSEFKDNYLIRRTDGASVALDKKNTEDNDRNARQYVEQVKERCDIKVKERGCRAGVSTLFLVYNATGDNVTFVTSHDWEGHNGPAPRPGLIANGQWGAFLHVENIRGSSAAVVYRGKNEVGNDCDWMVSWSNGGRYANTKTAYTEIRKAGYYDDNDHWDDICIELCSSGLNHNATCNGCFSIVSIGSDTSPIFFGNTHAKK